LRQSGTLAAFICLLKLYTMKKATQYLPYAAACFFILLFCYTAVSKIKGFEDFQQQLAVSPLVSPYTGFISYGVIFIELAVSALLIFPVMRKIGLLMSFVLMTAFTGYVWLILNYSYFIPCSCGGILEKMGWTEHLIFNSAATLFAGAGFYLMSPEKQSKPSSFYFQLGLTGLATLAGVFLLARTSEHMTRNENNFIRIFPPHPITEEKALDLGFDSYYFAGHDGSKLYLGNPSTPFRLLSIDFGLGGIDTLEVRPETDHIFRNLQYRVEHGELYGFDGTVPVIYKANNLPRDLLLREISHQEVYFDQLTHLPGDQFMLRVEDKASGKTALAVLNPGMRQPVVSNDDLLTKKRDGGFDADGQLVYDDRQNRVYYFFYYKNPILQVNTELENQLQLKTIDTMSQAKLEVTTLAGGRRKLAAPPMVSNRTMEASGGLLFVESGLRGRYETSEMWRKNAVVDLYSTAPAGYAGSMYVQHRGKSQMRQMLVTGSHFFILSGDELVRYRLERIITDKIR